MPTPIRFKGIVGTTAQIATGRFAGRIAFDSTLNRFVMFYDPTTPDLIRGYIQPYLYTLTDRFGELNLTPGTPFPTPDPIGPLPSTCDPTQVTANPLCLGTLHFVVRRIPAR